ncbi:MULTISPECIES: type VI secretion system protein TssA [Pseudomonas]|uniref:type VI secretion system protein TssA n=1 Tax=Pseudomonas TaxID=286 RepID=UPI00236044B7|nr:MULTISPECIES: type VI secretion system protein TssA [Pseudomonas]WJV27618.1 type VI secretion system protein TssA [Pseudomonas chlororaphis]
MSPLDLDALLVPLDEKQPAGFFDEEDGTFQDIEHEMVKLGGLQEPNMDWSFIDEATRLYLTKQCKHFRIAGHLITARLRPPSWQGWADGVGVLSGMVCTYWESGYPKPGPTGLPMKRRLVALLVERLCEVLPKLEVDGTAHTAQAAAQRAIDQLQASAGAAKLDVPMLTHLESQFSRRVEETRYPTSEPSREALPASRGQTVTEAYFSTSSTPKLGDERESKRTLLAVAEFINEQNSYDPTGYLLRRFALWGHLTTAPPGRHDQRTELRGIPQDISEGYREALSENNISPVLLQRVEKSVASSPYWLQGSHYAAIIALRMEMPEVASSIRLATERFVLRIPGLKALHFSDGRPFVDGETLAWLSGIDEHAGQAADGREYAALREELAALMENGGVEHMLRRLESLQAEAEDTRHRCHVMSIAASLVSARGFTWLAEGLYRTAYGLMDGASISTWEPALYNHLAAQIRDARPPAPQGTTD